MLAPILSVEGPSCRAPGAMMPQLPVGLPVGRLSSCCIEADLALHAEKARRSGRPVALGHGLGSPFRENALPGGAGST